MSNSPPQAVAPARLEIRLDKTVPVLVIPPHMAFEDLREWLRSEIPDHEMAVEGRTARLDLGQRELKLFDLRRLVHFLREDFAIDITGIYVASEVVTRFAERELKLKLFPLAEAAPVVVETEKDSLDPEAEVTEAAAEPVDADDSVATDTDETHEESSDQLSLGEVVDVEASEVTETTAEALETDALPSTPTGAPERERADKRTLTVRRTLRSGASVRYDGDVFVFGDVNPGAHVVASGNIVIMGSLKGMGHAGAAGDDSCFILSLDMRPTQLRIGRKIAIAPERRSPGDVLQPELASVVDGQIVLEPYQGRLRSVSGRA